MLNDQLSKEALHRPHGGILPQRKRSEINIFNCYLNTVHFFAPLEPLGIYSTAEQ